MVRDLDDLGQQAVGRHAGEAQPRRLQRVAIGDVDLVAVAVALADPGRAVDLGDPAFRVEHRVIGAEPHRAAEIAVGLAPLQLVAAHPFGHQPDDRMLARAELGRAGAGQPREMPRRLDHRHLHAEADAEIRHLPLAREARRLDLALGAALAEPARHEDAVHAFELLHRLAPRPRRSRESIQSSLTAHIVGDAAMGHRLGQRFVAVEQVRVLADDGDRDLALGPADAADDLVPAREIGLRRVEAEMGADLAVEPLGVIGAGHGIDRVDVERRDDPRLRADCRTARSSCARPPGSAGRSGTAGCRAGCRGRAAPSPNAGSAWS